MANSEDSPLLTWKRPESVDFPKVWHTFQARDIDSDNLVEYRIQDLPLNRVDDCYRHLFDTLIPDEPIGQALGYENDPHIYDDYKRFWEPVIAQQTVLVCFKEDSDEIIGANLVFVSTREDKYFEDIRECFKGHTAIELFDVMDILYENYDPFEEYQIDKYMSSLGLAVDRKYRGRGIGHNFLISRKAMCRAFGVKLTQTAFTSDYSNANADRAGFKTDVVMDYSDIVDKYPKLARLANIKSTQIALKSLVI